MEREELVFKSKAQADRLRIEFIDRYGEEDGNKKFIEVSRRSPKYEDLPERIPTSFSHKPKKLGVPKKLGKRWRGF